MLTNQHGDPVTLEARHRARARVEDAIRAAKNTGMANLPFRALAPNAAWLELVLIAQDFTSWAQSLLLDGDLARAEPKRLRYRILHVAGRLTHSGRATRLQLPAAWPWASALAGAFTRRQPRPRRGRGSTGRVCWTSSARSDPSEADGSQRSSSAPERPPRLRPTRVRSRTLREFLDCQEARRF